MTDRVVRDNRRGWHISREVPLMLIYAVTGLLAIGFTGYIRLVDKVEDQGKQIVTLVAALTETNKEVRKLTETLSSKDGPNAEDRLRVQFLEQQMLEFKTRLGDLERASTTREARIGRLESGLGSVTMRQRAREQ